jgi:uncharacterized protein
MAEFELTYEMLGGGRGRLTTKVDGISCEITWFDRKDGIRVIDHTRVPDAVAGRGVAAALTAAALERAKADSVKVLPQCSYVQTWLRRHLEWAHMISD